MMSNTGEFYLPDETWPQGSYIKMQKLHDLLLDSAQRHSQNALDKFSSEHVSDQLDAAVSVGCCVEHLAKSYLASIHPTLIAERVDRDTILHLSGKSGLAQSPATQMKTRGAHDSLMCVKQFLPTLRYNTNNDGLVLQVRNAALHMSLVDFSELRKAIVGMIRIADDVLAAISLRRDSFWIARQLPIVDDMLDTAVDETKKIVAAKLASARLRLTQITRGLPSETSDLVLLALSGKQFTGADYEQDHACPACSQMGWLICSVEDERFFDQSDDDSQVASFIAYPFEFECSVCGLDLVKDELAIFDFPNEIEIPPRCVVRRQRKSRNDATAGN
jgi:hypothetical protein